MRLPVVTSPRACIALGVKPEKHLLVAHSTNTFAQQVSRLLDDRELREQIGDAGRRYVEEHHSLSTIARQLVAVYEDVVESHEEDQ